MKLLTPVLAMAQLLFTQEPISDCEPALPCQNWFPSTYPVSQEDIQKLCRTYGEVLQIPGISCECPEVGED